MLRTCEKLFTFSIMHSLPHELGKGKKHNHNQSNTERKHKHAASADAIQLTILTNIKTLLHESRNLEKMTFTRNILHSLLNFIKEVFCAFEEAGGTLAITRIP
jgi:hypothetical protein